MPNYPLEPRNGLLPARINRQLARQEARAALASQQDTLRIRRSVAAARNSLIGIAEIGALAGGLAQEVPWVARELETATRATTVTLIGHIYDSRY